MVGGGVWGVVFVHAGLGLRGWDSLFGMFGGFGVGKGGHGMSVRFKDWGACCGE